MALTTVRVPTHLTDLFEQAQDYVRRYFSEQVSSPDRGTLEVCGQRYVLIRAASVSAEFHALVRKFYSEDAEALAVVEAMLFDVAHAMGLADAASFAKRMNVTDPIARLSAGPIHFAHAGWAFVDILPESLPSPDENFYLLYDHPSSFESDSWLDAKLRSERPVCTMNAGYSSGWCESSFGLPLVATEILCRAKGDDTCRFIMAPAERIEDHIVRYADTHPELAARIANHQVLRFLGSRTDRQLVRRNIELEQRERDRTRELVAINEQLKSDIAVRERTERALSASMELNERLIEALPGGVVHVKSDGSIVRANPEARRILGMPLDALTHRYVKDFDMETIYEDGSVARAEDYPVSRAIATGQAQPATTMGIRRPDGETAWAVFRAVPTRDPETQAINGAVVTFFDITERKRFEDKMRHAQKLESLGVLAGGIAHDFNNLLVSILGNASYAKELPQCDAELLEVFGDIETGARRAAEFTRQMLDYAGQNQVRVETIDLGIVVREIGKLLRSVVPKQVEFRYHFQEDLAVIEADPAQVRQVVMNLITNAAEATTDGQRRIVIGLERRDVGPDILERYLADGASPGPHVALEVEDMGVGMTTETVARVFDPFFTTKFKGRGLGMAAVLGIVRAHRGAIAIDSREGLGTKVTVLWPIRTREAAVAPQSDAKNRGTILVVDDDSGVRNLLRRALTGRGYQVLLAPDAKSGLHTFEQRESTISLVMMDVTMPGMSGFDAIKELRSRGSKVPVLLSSGYEVDRAFAAIHDVAAVLEKPYDIGALLTAVESAIGKNESP